MENGTTYLERIIIVIEKKELKELIIFPVQLYFLLVNAMYFILLPIFGFPLGLKLISYMDFVFIIVK